MKQLLTAVNGRPATTHVHNVNTLLNWYEYPSSQAHVCKGMNNEQTAIRIEKIRRNLNAARCGECKHVPVVEQCSCPVYKLVDYGYQIFAELHYPPYLSLLSVLANS